MGGNSCVLRRTFFYILAGYILLLVIAPLLGGFERLNWLVSLFIVAALSLGILLKNGLPSGKQILIAAILGGLVLVTSPLSGVVTFFSALASQRILQGQDVAPPILRRPLWKTVTLGIVAGFVLAFINTFLAGATSSFQPSFSIFLVALVPGISEEICFRFFIYAFAFYQLGRAPETKRELTWLYVLLIVPHVLLHFPVFNSQFIVGVFLLSLIFGLPLTLLMTKHDVLSAMIAHTIVDLIRFFLFGLPI